MEPGGNLLRGNQRRTQKRGNERESWVYRKTKMMIATAGKRKYRRDLSIYSVAAGTSAFILPIVGVEKKDYIDRILKTPD